MELNQNIYVYHPHIIVWFLFLLSGGCFLFFSFSKQSLKTLMLPKGTLEQIVYLIFSHLSYHLIIVARNLTEDEFYRHLLFL